MMKWMRGLYILIVNLITLPFVPVIGIFLSAAIAVAGVHYGWSVEEIFDGIAGLWKAMVNGGKEGLRKNIDYIQNGN